MSDWRALELRLIADREQRRVDTLRRLADNLEAGRHMAEGDGVRGGAPQEAVTEAGFAERPVARSAACAGHGSQNEPARHGDCLGGRE